jgi:hypothetical protein
MGLFKQLVTWKNKSVKLTKVTNKKTGKTKSVISKVGKSPSKAGLGKKRRK